MAIQWSWKEKCGEIQVLEDQGDQMIHYNLSLYEGNALLIMLLESGEGWTMWSFWADRDHMKNCLGLAKGSDNIYNRPNIRFKKIIVNPDKSRYWKTWLPAFVAAFDRIDICIDKKERWE